jgi:hypothetical protein
VESLARDLLSSKIRKVGRLTGLKNEDWHIGRWEYLGMDM